MMKWIHAVHPVLLSPLPVCWSIVELHIKKESKTPTTVTDYQSGDAVIVSPLWKVPVWQSFSG